MAAVEPAGDPTLQSVESAKRALDRMETVDEAADMVDRAEVARTYARKAKLGLEAQNHAATIKLLAERRAGELLEENRDELKSRVSDSVSLSDMGVTRKESSRWQQVAELPEDEFDSYVSDRRDSGEEVTTAGALRLAKKRRADRRREQQRQRVADLADRDVPKPDRRYAVIYADPPWSYDFSVSDSRQVHNHYPTMPPAEIAAKDVPAADDAVLFLWATSPKLPGALEVMDGWGFDYVTSMVWVKDRIGMGYYARQRHELLLIGKRGTLPTPEPGDRPDSVIEAPRGRHSAKPDRVYGLLESMYPTLPKVELFAREQRAGWDVALSNEVAA